MISTHATVPVAQPDGCGAGRLLPGRACQTARARWAGRGQLAQMARVRRCIAAQPQASDAGASPLAARAMQRSSRESSSSSQSLPRRPGGAARQPSCCKA